VSFENSTKEVLIQIGKKESREVVNTSQSHGKGAIVFAASNFVEIKIT